MLLFSPHIFINKNGTDAQRVKKGKGIDTLEFEPIDLTHIPKVGVDSGVGSLNRFRGIEVGVGVTWKPINSAALLIAPLAGPYLRPP